MKRSELISWLHGHDVQDVDDKNPKIIITDGESVYNVLSVYTNETVIYIDIELKEI